MAKYWLFFATIFFISHVFHCKNKKLKIKISYLKSMPKQTQHGCVLCCKKLLLILFFIRLSNGWLLELILTTNKHLLIIELMTFNAKTRVFYNRANLLNLVIL